MKKLISLFLAIVASLSVAIAETTIIYKEPFSSSQGNFAVVHKNLPAGLSYVWSWRNAAYGMVASAYVSGTAYAAESWLISPSISLQNYTSASLSFDHAVNKGAPTNLKVKISTNDGSTWSDLTISQWPEGTNWDFINAAVSLDAYVGNSIKIAFVYISTASICPQWEIKNFQIIATEQITDPIITPQMPEGALSGVFSVSADKKICFSIGNLQYNIAQGSHQCADGTTQPGTWRFAANQWDVIKNANENASATYDGWIDLFPWGASGYNGKFPYLSNASYNNSFFSNGNSDISGTMYDWGVYNEISNGGSYGVWRLPTAAEYEYLFTQRPNALNLYKKDVAVNNVKGLVLCPDNWDLTITILSSYTQSAWESMEAQGAVFLPYGGVKDYSAVGGVGWYYVGYYWSGTNSPTEGKAIALDTYSMQTVGHNEHFVSHGRSVRLVREIPQSYTITWKQDNGIVIDETVVCEGEIPTHEELTKMATDYYTYSFAGWDPEIVPAYSDATYIAKYDSVCIQQYPADSLIGEFSVSTDRKVYFSPGNLQYQASTDMWRFAEHQWDYIGDANLGTVYEDGVKCNNALLSSTYSGWIDLFGYSTATTYYGVSTSKNNSTYAGEFVDWGQVFQSQWRTLTRNEWEYLLNKRPKHASLFAFVRVEGVKGLLLLPDNFIGDYNITTDYNYSSSEFASLEALGAIFLPANGYRDGTTPKTVQTEGEYYANTSHLNNLVDGMQFGYNSRRVCADANNNRYDGRGVRLVKDIDQNANDSTQVDSDSTAMATNLNMIYIKGDSIEGFSSNKYTYTFTYSAGTNQQDLPSSTDISWDLGDEYQTVTATQAGNTIVLTVISGRGLVTTYVLSFVIERPNQYTVTTLSNNDAWGIAIGGNVYNANVNVSIGAFANDGYQFYHWNNTITANPYTFQLTQDTSFVATFLPNTEEEIITDVTSNSVHMEWEVKPWGNHGYWVWVYIDKDHKQWYCKMRFYADGTLSKFYWGPASKHYDASNPPLEIPVFRAPQRYFDATTISYDLSDIEADLQYFYTIEGVDEYDNVISVIAGTFKTPAHTSDIDNIDSSLLQGGDRGRLILRNGMIYIVRDGKMFDLTGVQVK